MKDFVSNSGASSSAHLLSSHPFTIPHYLIPSHPTMPPPESHGQVTTTIHTTVPVLPPSSSRPHVTTPRLLLRALAPSDLEAVHALRRQPEVMRWTSAGRVDEDPAQTAARLALYLPPNDTSTFNCAICLRETGELVGMGGVHQFEPAPGDTSSPGWPEVGYMLRRESWGGGIATEFLGAFLVMWEGLPREVVERTVDVRSLSLAGRAEGAGLVAEQLVAVIDGKNSGSQRVLEKCGFQRFLVYEDVDNHNAERMMELVAYRYFPQKKAAE